MAPLVPIPSACVSDGLGHTITHAGGPVDGATGARPLCSSTQQRSSHGRPNGWRRWCPSPSCHQTSVTASLAGHTHFGLRSSHLSPTWLDAGISCTRRASCSTPCAASPPTLFVFTLFPCWCSRPSWAPSVPRWPSAVARPCLLLRARCIATHRAPWFPVLLCFRLLSVHLCVPVLSLRPLFPPERALCRASNPCPLQPFRLPAPAPSIPLPFGHNACQYAVHLARNSPFHGLDTSWSLSDAWPAACIAPRASSPYVGHLAGDDAVASFPQLFVSCPTCV